MRAHFPRTRLWTPAPRSDAAARSGYGPSAERIASALAELRRSGRRAIRILDLGCGDGARLLRAAACARELGFVAIEGRGIDPSPSRIRHARTAAAFESHPSTTLCFEIAEPIEALAAEHDGAVDLVLLSEPRPYPVSPLAVALDRVALGPLLYAP